jgi:predicted NACHT family NTPase
MDSTIVGALIAAAAALVAAALAAYMHWPQRRQTKAKANEDADTERRRHVWEASKHEYLGRLSRDLSAVQTALGAGPLQLDDVYVWLSLRDAQGESVKDDELIVPARDQELTPRRIAVIGDAGSGKSTLVRRWAASFAMQAEGGTDAAMPFVVPLRMAAQSRRAVDLADLGIRHIYGTGHPQTDSLRESVELSLRQGLAAVFLDGADEIPENRRDSVRAAIDRLCSHHEQNLIVLTSRPSRYAEAMRGFNIYSLEHFGETQRDLLIKHWIPPQDARKHALIMELVQRRGGQMLWSNPLYLTMACELIKADRPLDALTTGALFEQFVQLLLEYWPRDIRDTPLSYQTHLKTALLQNIAEWMWPRQAQVIEDTRLFSLGFPKDRTDLAGLIREIESTSGILRKDRLGYHGFMHPLFEEFFVARAIAMRIAESPDPKSAEIQFSRDHPINDQRYNHIAAFVPALLALRDGGLSW